MNSMISDFGQGAVLAPLEGFFDFKKQRELPTLTTGKH